MYLSVHVFMYVYKHGYIHYELCYRLRYARDIIPVLTQRLKSLQQLVMSVKIKGYKCMYIKQIPNFEFQKTIYQRKDIKRKKN